MESLPPKDPNWVRVREPKTLKEGFVPFRILSIPEEGEKKEKPSIFLRSAATSPSPFSSSLAPTKPPRTSPSSLSPFPSSRSRSPVSPSPSPSPSPSLSRSRSPVSPRFQSSRTTSSPSLSPTRTARSSSPSSLSSSSPSSSSGSAEFCEGDYLVAMYPFEVRYFFQVYLYHLKLFLLLI